MLNPPKLIGIVGFSRSGKDTVANYLVKQYGYRQLAFADTLKAILARIYSLPLTMLSNEATRNIPLPLLGNHTIREALQTIGTEAFRNFYPDTWCNCLVHELEYHGFNVSGINRCFVVSDIRFENELATIKELGGTIIYLDRLEVIPKILSNLISIFGANKFTQCIATRLSAKYSHPSEFGIFKLKDKADYVITNSDDTSLLALQRQIDVTLEYIGDKNNA